jgi:mitotic spindle assembly checkpoint protein MAD2
MNSILFQRSVYPEDDFHMVKKYGQTVLVTQDLAVEEYLEKCVSLATRPGVDAHDHLSGS